MPRQQFAILMALLSLASFNACADSISVFVEKWRQENQIPAVALAIKTADKSPIYFLNGTTRLNGKISITENNLFGVGSITKTFIAATMLQLQEENKINLDDPIGKYFPEYPRWKKITIRQLLGMTSGISNFTKTKPFQTLINNEPTSYHSPSFFVDLAYQQKDEFLPEKGWFYSNTNYYLLGMIIEKVTKQNLSYELQERFFKPLHLNNTYYAANTYPAAIGKRQAHAYLDAKDVTKENPSYYGAAGCMLMNTKDLLTWTQALFTPGNVLSQHSLDELMKTHAVPHNPPKPDGARYGLGIYSLNLPDDGLVWWYTGVVDGYSSILMWIPKKQIIIAAQINRWKNDTFGLLMPGQDFVNTVLKKI